MPESGEMNLGLESLKGFAAKLVQAVIGFVGTIIFARVLGPTGFGGFYLLWAVVQVSDRPMRGVSQAVRKRYSEAGANRGEIVGSVLLFNLVLVALVGAGVILLEGQLIALTHIESAALVFMALFIAVGVFFPFQQMLAAEGWVGKQTWNDTLRSVFTLPLQLGFVFAGFGAAGMGYGLAGATVLVVPVALYFLRIWPARPSSDTLRSMWEFAKYSTPSAVVGKTYDRFDILLIGFVLSAGAAAQYEVALKLTLPATFLFSVIAAGLMPKISNLHSRGEPVATDVTNAISYVSILSIPIFFGALAIPRGLVVTAYGPDYRAASTLLIGLALYQVARSQTIVHRQTIEGLDRPDIGLKIDAVVLVFNVLVGLALVFPYGAIGVVAATVLAESGRYLLSAYVVSKLTEGVEFLPRTLGEQVVAGVVMFGAVKLVAVYIPVRSWLYLLPLVGTGVIVYGVVLLGISDGLRFTLRAVYRDAIA